MALGEYVVHEESDYSPIETEGESEVDFGTDTPAQSSHTATSIVLLLSGVGIFITGAILAAEREK